LRPGRPFHPLLARHEGQRSGPKTRVEPWCEPLGPALSSGVEEGAYGLLTNRAMTAAHTTEGTEE